MTELQDTARWLAKQLTATQDSVRALSTPQLGASSIETGSVEEYDVDGTLMSVMGEQFDGTHAAVTLAGPVPPEPTPPTITPGPSQAVVRWSGLFADDALSPMDFSHVAVHASREDIFEPDSTTQLATITGESGDSATALLDPGPWTFVLVAVSLAGKWSIPSDPVAAEVPDNPLSDMQDTITQFDTDLTSTQASVNGKNTITNATAAPGTAVGVTVGDRWQVWSTLATGGKLTGSWRWDGTQWIKEALDPSYLPLVDIGAGTFGTLDGGRLLANSVTANSLSATAIDGKTITGVTVVGGQVTTTTAPGAVAARMGPIAMQDAAGASYPGIGFLPVGSSALPAGMYSSDGSALYLVQGGVPPPGGGVGSSLGLYSNQAVLTGYGHILVQAGAGGSGVTVDGQSGPVALNGSTIKANGTDIVPVHGTYTPVLTGATTNPSLGTGTATGSYNLVGKQMTVEFFVPFGTGGSIGSGAYQISLPPGFSYGGLGSAIARGVFTAHIGASLDVSGFVKQTVSSGNTFQMYWQSATTTASPIGSNTVAWTSGLYMSGTIHVPIQ